MRYGFSHFSFWCLLFWLSMRWPNSYATHVFELMVVLNFFGGGGNWEWQEEDFQCPDWEMTWSNLLVCLCETFSHVHVCLIGKTIEKIVLTVSKQCHQNNRQGLNSLLAAVPAEWCVHLSAAVHDSGMIKDLYWILILPLCCQQSFPVPHTKACKLMQLCTTWQWERKMGSRSSVTEKQNASFPFVWNGAEPRSKPCSSDRSFHIQWKPATWSVIIHRQCVHSTLCHCWWNTKDTRTLMNYLFAVYTKQS